MEEEKKTEQQNPNDLLGMDFLHELGIDAKTLEILKAKFGTVIADIIKEHYRYAEEEKRILGIRDHAVKSIGDLLVQNIFSARNFLLTITGFSLAVIGAIFSVLASPNQTIFTPLWVVYVGVSMLGLCVVLSVIYLLQKLTIENQSLSKYLEFQRSATERLHSVLIEYVQENKPYAEYINAREPLQDEFREHEKKFMNAARKKSIQKDWTPHIITLLFLGGLIVIATAFFLK